MPFASLLPRAAALPYTMPPEANPLARLTDLRRAGLSAHQSFVSRREDE